MVVLDDGPAEPDRHLVDTLHQSGCRGAGVIRAGESQRQPPRQGLRHLESTNAMLANFWTGDLPWRPDLGYGSGAQPPARRASAKGRSEA
jgi:hypothetical protein